MSNANLALGAAHKARWLTMSYSDSQKVSSSIRLQGDRNKGTVPATRHRLSCKYQLRLMR